MGIGKTLSIILGEKNIKPNDLAERLGITPSTIYSIIKRDNTKVDITVLARICKELDVSMERFYDEYITESQNKFTFTSSEKILVKKYRNLDQYGKRMVDSALNIEYERCTSQQIDNENLILSSVAARSEGNKTKIHTEYTQDLSKYAPDDSDL